MLRRGIGNILAGPISGVLLGTKEQASTYEISKYERMVLFTGLTMAVSALSVVGKLFLPGVLPRHA